EDFVVGQMMLLAADALLPSRIQMAFTLASHVLLVPLGVALPSLTLLMEGIGLWRKDPVALTIARRWSVVMAVQFAVGAVTGTILSFEFGILWPRMMGRFGAAFGLGFAIEGLAFFAEAIFIGIYLYGCGRVRLRGGVAARAPRSLSEARFRSPVHSRRRVDAGAAAGGRPRLARDRRGSARKVRRGRDHLDYAGSQPGGRGRLYRRGGRRPPRDSDSLARLLAGRILAGRHRPRPHELRRGRPPEHPRGEPHPSCLRHHGRSGVGGLCSVR